MAINNTANKALCRIASASVGIMRHHAIDGTDEDRVQAALDSLLVEVERLQQAEDIAGLIRLADELEAELACWEAAADEDDEITEEWTREDEEDVRAHARGDEQWLEDRGQL